MKLVIWVPYLPPGINQTYRIQRGGRRIYKTKEANKWAADAALLIGAEAGRIGWENGDGEFRLSTTVSQAKHDADAFVKLVQDTVADKLGFNDKRISERSVRREDLGEQGILIVLEHL